MQQAFCKYNTNCSCCCQGYAPYLEREIRGRHSLPRVLHYIAWTQAGVCTVFLLLLVSDSELHFARMPVQQEARQQQQQRCDKQQQGFSSCISSIEGTYQSRLTPALPTPKLSSKQCLPIMVCSMLSKSRSTASLYRNHCSHSSPGTHYSGLLPSCTIAAARYSLLLLDVLGLLLAVALLHLTWPRDVHTVVPAWAWVPNGVLPVNHQQLNGPWQAQHGSSGSGDVHNLGQGIGEQECFLPCALPWSFMPQALRQPVIKLPGWCSLYLVCCQLAVTCDTGPPFCNQPSAGLGTAPVLQC